MNHERDTPGGEPEDDALLAELRALAGRHDPLPPEAVAAARSALAYWTMDAELAELVADSSTEQGTMALVRGVETPTMLTFESAAMSIEVEVLVRGDHRRLLGQLVPPQAAAVQVSHRGGRDVVAADEVGRFTADEVSPGPVSLRCQAGDGPQARVVMTDWFLA